MRLLHQGKHILSAQNTDCAVSLVSEKDGEDLEVSKVESGINYGGLSSNEVEMGLTRVEKKYKEALRSAKKGDTNALFNYSLRDLSSISDTSGSEFVFEGIQS
jgi:hypothetical protein